MRVEETPVLGLGPKASDDIVEPPAPDFDLGASSASAGMATSRTKAATFFCTSAISGGSSKSIIVHSVRLIGVHKST